MERFKSHLHTSSSISYTASSSLLLVSCESTNSKLHCFAFHFFLARHDDIFFLYSRYFFMKIYSVIPQLTSDEKDSPGYTYTYTPSYNDSNGGASSPPTRTASYFRSTRRRRGETETSYEQPKFRVNLGCCAINIWNRTVSIFLITGVSWVSESGFVQGTNILFCYWWILSIYFIFLITWFYSCRTLKFWKYSFVKITEIMDRSNVKNILERSSRLTPQKILHFGQMSEPRQISMNHTPTIGFNRIENILRLK